MQYDKIEDDLIAIKYHMVNILDIHCDLGRCPPWRPLSDEDIIDFIMCHFNDDTDESE